MGHPPSKIYRSVLPTRILLSAALLAFAVSTSTNPLTIQVEVVLDDVKTGLTPADYVYADDATTTALCTDLKEIAFLELKYYPKVRLHELYPLLLAGPVPLGEEV